MFCNILNVFTDIFDQFNASLLNKSIYFYLKKSYWPQIFELQCKKMIFYFMYSMQFLGHLGF